MRETNICRSFFNQLPIIVRCLLKTVTSIDIPFSHKLNKVLEFPIDFGAEEYSCRGAARFHLPYANLVATTEFGNKLNNWR